MKIRHESYKLIAFDPKCQYWPKIVFLYFARISSSIILYSFLILLLFLQRADIRERLMIVWQWLRHNTQIYWILIHRRCCCSIYYPNRTTLSNCKEKRQLGPEDTLHREHQSGQQSCGERCAEKSTRVAINRAALSPAKTWVTNMSRVCNHPVWQAARVLESLAHVRDARVAGGAREKSSQAAAGDVEECASPLDHFFPPKNRLALALQMAEVVRRAVFPSTVPQSASGKQQ